MLASVLALDLADGIKETLISNGLDSLDTLLEIRSEDLALLLGIDTYVARLIHTAAKRHAEAERVQVEINHQESADAWKRAGLLQAIA